MKVNELSISLLELLGLTKASMCFAKKSFLKMTQNRRLQKEIGVVMAEGNEYISVDADNLTLWNCVLTGPPNTPFADGKFKFTVKFPVDYPFKPPTIKFNTKIYHPNFDEEGAICMGLVKSETWKPAINMKSILDGLVDLLVEPMADDPLDTSIAELYKTDRGKYDATVKEWVKKYAK